MPCVCVRQEQCDGGQSQWTTELSTTEVNTLGVEELVQTDRRVTLLHMAFDLSLYRKALSTGQ